MAFESHAKVGTMIKALFFDLDGTLVETSQANYLAYKQALSSRGLHFTLEEYLSYPGQSSKMFLGQIFSHLSSFEIEEIQQAKTELYPQYFSYTKVTESLLSVLGKNSEDYVTAVVTTAKKISAIKILNYHGIMEKIDFIIAAEDVKLSKPDPEAYILACEVAGVRPSEALAFEDSLVGIEAATKAGVAVLRV